MLGFPCSSVINEFVCSAGIPLRCRRLGFNSWVWKIPWRRKWQPTPVFFPGKSHGQRRLAGCSPWGGKSQTWLTTKPPQMYFTGFLFCLLYNMVLVLPYIDLNPSCVYMYSPPWTPLPPPSPSHPSGSSQCTSPEHPVSCIEPGLVFHFTYDNLHVSMPFSHIIPPSPSPTESKRQGFFFF